MTCDQCPLNLMCWSGWLSRGVCTQCGAGILVASLSITYYIVPCPTEAPVPITGVELACPACKPWEGFTRTTAERGEIYSVTLADGVFLTKPLTREAFTDMFDAILKQPFQPTRHILTWPAK